MQLYDQGGSGSKSGSWSGSVTTKNGKSYKASGIFTGNSTVEFSELSVWYSSSNPNYCQYCKGSLTSVDSIKSFSITATDNYGNAASKTFTF